MHVLVTGANGFVGAALCKKLLERGDTVRGMVRKTSDLSLLKDVPIEIMYGTLDDADTCERVVADVEVVYHVASAVSDWGSLTFFRQVNVDGTRNILDASVRKHIRRFVFVSSAAVHSFIGAQDMTEDAPQDPTPFPYCQSKREAEIVVMDYHKKKKIETVIVRPGDVFGPGDRTSLLKMAQILEAGLMVYVGGGRTLGAFTYVENLVDGIILAGTQIKAAGEAFIITDGIKKTWREYFEKLTAVLELPKPRLSIHPVLLNGIAFLLEFIYHFFHIQTRPFVTQYLVAHLRHDFHFSIEKAKRILGYRPSVDFDEAIKRTAVWYKRMVRPSIR